MVSQPLSQTITYSKQKPKLDAPLKCPIDKDQPYPPHSISLFQGETQTEPQKSVSQRSITRKPNYEASTSTTSSLPHTHHTTAGTRAYDIPTHTPSLPLTKGHQRKYVFSSLYYYCIYHYSTVPTLIPNTPSIILHSFFSHYFLITELS
jgi:hypothetical protein